MTRPDLSTLPAPLVPPEVDLRDFKWMPIDVARLRDSSLAANEPPEACWAAMLLWCAAWHQVPAGSIPDDNQWQAKHAGYVAAGRIHPGWRRVRDAALHNFVKCSDGRLYHRIVSEKALEAWTSKLAQQARTKKATEARRKHSHDAPKGDRHVDRDVKRDVKRDDHATVTNRPDQTRDSNTGANARSGTTLGVARAGKPESPDLPEPGTVALRVLDGTVVEPVSTGKPEEPASSAAPPPDQPSDPPTPAPSPQPPAEPPAPSTPTPVDEPPRQPLQPSAVALPDPGLAVATPVAICAALRQAGIASVNASHPTLVALATAGATVEEFVAAAPKALAKADPFAYTLSTVAGRRRDAVALAASVHNGAMPQERPQTAREASRAARVAEFTSGVLSASPRAVSAPPSGEIIDMEASDGTPRSLG